MNYHTRIDLYRRIEELRNRPLISYVTSLRPHATGQMATDVISEIARQIPRINSSETQAVDVLIVSNGGDPTVAWRIISMLRELFKEVGVLLPYTAFSAATLLALGADEIVMHPFANLGPVDPQLTTIRPNNEGRQHFGSEDLIHYLAFVKEDVGITDQRELQNAFTLLCRDVGAIPVGAAKRSTQLSLSLGEKLLTLHMNDRNEARAITESLNKSFYHHGYPVGRSEAKKIGLPVTDANDELERLLWDVWLSIEEEMQCAKPFDPLKEVLADPIVSSLLSHVHQIQLPLNMPPELLQQAYNQILQQIRVANVPPVNCELFMATVESVRCRSEFKTKTSLNAVRLADMNIAVNITQTSEGWTFHEE